jgi:hypothetical protein
MILRYDEAMRMSIKDVLKTFAQPCQMLYYDTIQAFGRTRLDEQYLPLTHPIGTADPVTRAIKTCRDTNAISACNGVGLGSTRSLIAHQLRIVFPVDLPDGDIDAILKAGWMTFQLAEKQFWCGCLQVGIDQPLDLSGIDLPKEVKPQPLPVQVSGRSVTAKFGPLFIPALVPFQFQINFPDPPMLSFCGIQPIMIPIIDGIYDAGIV